MNIFALVGLLACWNVYLISKSVWHPGVRSAVPLAQSRAHCASDRHNYLTYHWVSFDLSTPPRSSSTVPPLHGEAGAFHVQLTSINVDISFRHTGNPHNKHLCQNDRQAHSPTWQMMPSGPACTSTTPLPTPTKSHNVSV